AGDVEIERGAAVLGDVILAGGDVTIRGDVGGEIRGSAGDLEIDGSVSGGVAVSVTDLSLGSRARVTGGVEYDSDNDIEEEDGSVVTGSIVQQEPNPMVPGASGMTWLTTKLFRLLCALVAGLVIVLVVPRAAVSIANAARYSLLGSFVRGLILIFAVPIATIILLVTIVGIPIGLIVLVSFIVTLYLSQVFVGLALGRFILPDRWGDLGRGYNLLAMTIGVNILFAPRFIPVPYLDAVISVIVALVGLGAAMVGVTMRRFAGRAEPPAAFARS
ncbi:MAG TPA: polymer-forming cytoskeletal protein, partial [Thermomicrobiales bacterium]|nr:polymer-forming cytoskeletal protein [Thermomicrobiales bacterium]